MKFFVDTAQIDEIKKTMELGVVDGVTTNPSLVAKVGRDYLTVVKEICNLCSGPVSAEVLSVEYDAMLEEARNWHKVAPNIVVKIPLTYDGIRCVSQCRRENIKTNVTLCFSSNQALIAAKAGATYISPFLGRLDDIGHDGLDLIHEIKTIYENYDFSTKILAASLRHPLHVKEVALAGAHVATIPSSLFSQILQHPLTAKGLEKFLEDAKTLPPHNF